MATLKRRLHRKNASGGYDAVYLQTISDLVLMSDGSTTLTSKISSMDTVINGKAAASHEHDHLNVQSSNEMNIAYGNTGADVYFNYRGSNATISDYVFANGKGGVLAKLSDLSKVGHTHSGYAASSHNQAASTITAGTFPATGIIAATGTDYTTARIRNIQASTSNLTAGSSGLSNGNVYLCYE